MNAVRQLYAEISLLDKASDPLRLVNKRLDESHEKLADHEKQIKHAGKAHEEAGPHMQVLSAVTGAMGLGFLLGAEAIAGATEKLIEFTQESVHLAAVAQHNETILKNLAGEGFGELEESLKKATVASEGVVNESSMNKAALSMLRLGLSAKEVGENISSIQKLSVAAGDGSAEAFQQMAQQVSTFVEFGNARTLRTIPILNKHFDMLKKLQGPGLELVRQQAISNILEKEHVRLDEMYRESLKDPVIQMQAISQSWERVKENIGKILMPSAEFLKYVRAILDYFGDTEKGITRIKYLLISIVGIFEPWVLVFEALYLVFDEFDAWISGDRDSVLEHMFGPFKNLAGWIENANKAIKEFFGEIYRSDAAGDLDKLLGINQHGEGKTASEYAKEHPEAPNGPGRAMGGPVLAGQTYTIGENGPETLVMGANSGNVIPGGGGQLMINFGTIPIQISGPGDLANRIKTEINDHIDEMANTTWRAIMGMAV